MALDKENMVSALEVRIKIITEQLGKGHAARMAFVPPVEGNKEECTNTTLGGDLYLP